MIKRTMGRFLLTVLVITGLAGTIRNNSISIRERKTAVTLMKDTRTELLNSIKGLSKKQLNFKSSQKWTIRECVYHIAASENSFWKLIENSLRSRANAEKRATITLTDEQVIRLVETSTGDFYSSEPVNVKKTNYRSLDAAINGFKKKRIDHIRYMRLTTEDLRNHVVEMPFGNIDCYQLCLMMAAHTDWHRQQIETIKSSVLFPK
jgi:hypothetical protein